MLNITSRLLWLTIFDIFQGMDVVKKVEGNPTGAQDKPKKEVLISDCGELEVAEPFSVEKADAVDMP